MMRTVRKIGNSQGIIFDVALMDMAHLKVGDEVVVTVHDGGSIMLTPVRPHIDAERAGWERLTVDVAASRLDRIETAGRLGTLLIQTRQRPPCDRRPRHRRVRLQVNVNERTEAGNIPLHWVARANRKRARRIAMSGIARSISQYSIVRIKCDSSVAPSCSSTS